MFLHIREYIRIINAPSYMFDKLGMKFRFLEILIYKLPRSSQVLKLLPLTYQRVSPVSQVLFKYEIP